MDILIQHQSHHKQNPFLGRFKMQKEMHSMNNWSSASLFLSFYRMASASQYKKAEKQVNERYNDLLRIPTLTLSGWIPILVPHKVIWNLNSM